jgi:hypothetical protein
LSQLQPIQGVDMSGNKIAYIIVIFIGIGLLAVSFLADVIGIGNEPGFGTQQMIGTIAGLVITVIGFVLTLKAK